MGRDRDAEWLVADTEHHEALRAFNQARRRGEALNLAAHKVVGVWQAIEAAGAHLRYLPPYNPGFNPIEQAFAKLKALLRSAVARTVPDLWAAIRNAFTRVKSNACRNYLAAAGYDAYDPA